TDIARASNGRSRAAPRTERSSIRPWSRSLSTASRIRRRPVAWPASGKIEHVIHTPSDERLLADARAGDKQALETLLERHQAQVYRFGMKMCRNPEDAKDVLQETLLAMARSVRDFRGASSISTWLYTIARSFCIKKRKRSKF